MAIYSYSYLAIYSYSYLAIYIYLNKAIYQRKFRGRNFRVTDF